MSFEVHLRADRRLIILRALAAETDYTLNEALLETRLLTFGHRITRTHVREELEWLAEAGAIAVTNPAGVDVYVARLLDPGLYHVENRAAIDGIARPRPGTR